jgi:hypothetical protein
MSNLTEDARSLKRAPFGSEFVSTVEHSEGDPAVMTTTRREDQELAWDETLERLRADRGHPARRVRQLDR